MVCAKDYIKQAGQILDEIISIDCRNGYLSVSWTSKEIEIVEDLLKKAIALEPNNPSYQYCLQQLKIARGLGKSGYEGIRELNNLYPEYIEATGFMSNPEKWLSPFLYPSWNKCSNQADKSFSRLPSGGTRLICVREGIKRTVCFFRNIHSGEMPENIKKAKIDIDFKLLETPYGPIAGLYTLIKPCKGDPRLSETLLTLDLCPAQMSDISVCGCWLIRLLAYQPYTYIILNDPKKGIILNHLHYFKSCRKNKLYKIADYARNVSQQNFFDKQKMDNARTYYMNNVSLKELF
ncbi:hypothetical protein J7L67_01280 [bacterium]|nr:hypothetical protein [bacterium]